MILLHPFVHAQEFIHLFCHLHLRTSFILCALKAGVKMRLLFLHTSPLVLRMKSWIFPSTRAKRKPRRFCRQNRMIEQLGIESAANYKLCSASSQQLHGNVTWTGGLSHGSQLTDKMSAPVPFLVSCTSPILLPYCTIAVRQKVRGCCARLRIVFLVIVFRMHAFI